MFNSISVKQSIVVRQVDADSFLFSIIDVFYNISFSYYVILCCIYSYYFIFNDNIDTNHNIIIIISSIYYLIFILYYSSSISYYPESIVAETSTYLIFTNITLPDNL